MISKKKTQLIKSLAQRKYREKHGLFVAEGPKLVEDLMAYFNAEIIFATETWLNNNAANAAEIIECSEAEIKSCSLQPSARSVMALFKLKRHQPDLGLLNTTLSIALDNIQDPGNLGTIIRVADWFGIRHIICSKDTVDIYNPKVVQSTMGSLGRVNVYYEDLTDILSDIKAPIYGTFLEGNNIYKTDLKSNGVIVMGNEGKGISTEVSEFISDKLFIPPFPADATTAESLNVAMATGIICSEFRRN